jgi:hypothetical protein
MSTKLQQIILVIAVLLCSFGIQAQEGIVRIDQDPDIDKLLDYKRDIKTLKIYKIQVFQSVDPDFAKKEKANFLELYEEWPVEIQWNTPNYKVWVGNFTTRLEADRALVKIKKNYINAIIFQPKLDKK